MDSKDTQAIFLVAFIFLNAYGFEFTPLKREDVQVRNILFFFVIS